MTEFRKMSPVFEEGMAPPPKKRGRSVPVFVLVLAGFGLCIVLIAVGSAALLPAISQARRESGRQTCLNNQSRLALANLLYAADHDDTLPLAGNWTIMTRPFLGRRQNFFLRCPDAERQGNGPFGIAYNSGLAGKTLSAIDDRQSAPLIFDTDAHGRGPAATPSTIPKPGRHIRGSVTGNNVAYADGNSRFVPDKNAR